MPLNCDIFWGGGHRRDTLGSSCISVGKKSFIFGVGGSKTGRNDTVLVPDFTESCLSSTDSSLSSIELTES